MAIVDDDGAEGADAFFFLGKVQATGFPPGPHTSVDVGVAFADASGTVFADEPLPALVDLAAFSEFIFQLQGADLPGFPGGIASGTTQTLTLRPPDGGNPIPEPATLALAAVGIAGLAARRRR